MYNVTLRISRESDTAYIVHTDESPAQLLAYCLCAEMTVYNDHVDCAGLTDESTELLEQALAALARGQGKWVRVDGDFSTVDGNA